jgi:cytoskeleton protein RodZ
MSADRGAGSFGSKLRDARERRGISLRQIANATKISVAALEALERNDLSRLPGGIFSRAFVRSYAVEVGLDPEATIREFIAQFPNDAAVTAGHPTSDRVEDHEAVESDRQTAGTFLWLAVVSVPLAIALVYFTSSGRRLAGMPPSSAPSADTPHAAAPPEPDAAPPAAASPPLAPTEAPPPPAPTEAPAASPPPAAPSAEKQAEPLRPASNQPAAALAAAAPADRLTIELAVKRPCWVSATVDGRKSIDRLLQPGERQTIDVRREMVLTAGDAAAIALTFNGAEGRPLGKAGEVVTARFNLNNFKSYVQTP